MKSHLEELANNEAILLMYLFNELLPDDRAEVEQMLQTDAGLRAEYARLLETNAHLAAVIQGVDAQSPMPIASSTAERQVDRLIQRWNTRRVVAAPSVVSIRRGLPVWLYPVTAAAMVLIGWLIFWGFREGPLDDGHQDRSPLVEERPEDRPDERLDYGPGRRPLNPWTDAQVALIRSLDSTDELQDAEQQLQAIADRRDDATPVLSMDTLTR